MTTDSRFEPITNAVNLGIDMQNFVARRHLRKLLMTLNRNRFAERIEINTEVVASLWLDVAL
jgi:hypothetical protein